MILSVSRRTDVPAFFAQWFYNRIRDGFVYVRNPVHPRRVSRIAFSPETVECVVFWTKNPSAEFISGLPMLDKWGYRYYVQFTLTAYDKSIEPNVPCKKELIRTFMELSEKIGTERVVWRYDPIFFNGTYTFDYHARYFDVLARTLAPYTEKCVFSFIDCYSKIKKRFESGLLRELTRDEMVRIAVLIRQITDAYGITAQSCCEDIDLAEVAVARAHCIDGDLINRISGKTYAFKKDVGQRALCGCAASVDIGAYDTCRHGCVYCYANDYRVGRVPAGKAGTLPELYANPPLGCDAGGLSSAYDPESPLLCSAVRSDDIITERILRSCVRVERSFEF